METPPFPFYGLGLVSRHPGTCHRAAALRQSLYGGSLQLRYCHRFVDNGGLDGCRLVGGAASRLIVGTCCIAAITACLILAREQLGYWKDSETLFRHALAVNPKDFVAFQNLGF